MFDASNQYKWIRMQQHDLVNCFEINVIEDNSSLYFKYLIP